MSFLIGAAGTMLGANQAAEVPVQMQTATFDSFSHWMFVWQTALEVEVLILAFLFFVFRPYIPFVVSKVWTHLPVVGIMNRVRNVAPFGGFSLRNGMYRREWGNNIMYYVKKYLGSYMFMGVAFDIVHIDRGFVQDPIANKYLTTLSMMGYKNHRDIDNALTFNGIDKDAEDAGEILAKLGFNSYEDAQEYLNPSLICNTTTLYAPKYSNIPLDALLPFGKDIGPGSIAGVIDNLFEYRKPPMEEPEWMKLLPFIIFLFAMSICAIMLIMVVK
jgi:hypothetical protein